MKNSNPFSLFLFFLPVVSYLFSTAYFLPQAFAARETLSIETYYPAPYGSFFEIKSIGNNELSTNAGTTTRVGTSGTTDSEDKLIVFGEVGIGTATPNQKLHIRSNVDAAVYLEADTDNNNPIENDNAFIKFSQDNSAVQAILGTVGSADFDPENNAYTGAVANSTLLGTLDTNGSLQFGTNDIVRMTITPGAGNVGIGTAPQTRLTLYEAANVSALSMRGNDGNATQLQMSFRGDNWGEFARIEGQQDLPAGAGTPTDGHLSFYTLDGSTLGERMRISDSGNVGIGTTAPTYRLEIGNGKAGDTGAMYISALLNSSGKGLVIDSTTRTNLDNNILAFEIINRAGTNTMAATVAGNVGIGTAAPSQKLEVLGVTLSGDVSNATNGSLGYGITYSGANITSTFGSMHSSGAPVLGYAVKPKNGSGGFVSSAGNSNFSKGALEISNTLTFSNSAAATVAIGTDVVMTPRFFVDANGEVTAYAYYYVSDFNLKNNIQPLSASLANILKLNGLSYNFKDKDIGKRSIGLVAQDVEKIYPELVSTNEKGVKSLNYSGLIAPLIEAVKEQQKEIEELKTKVKKLEAGAEQ